MPMSGLWESAPVLSVHTRRWGPTSIGTGCVGPVRPEVEREFPVEPELYAPGASVCGYSGPAVHALVVGVEPCRVPGDIMARLAWEGAAPDDQLLGAVKGAWSGVEVENLLGGVEVVGK
jgi:hypothetical protein